MLLDFRNDAASAAVVLRPIAHVDWRVCRRERVDFIRSLQDLVVARRMDQCARSRRRPNPRPTGYRGCRGVHRLRLAGEQANAPRRASDAASNRLRVLSDVPATAEFILSATALIGLSATAVSRSAPGSLRNAPSHAFPIPNSSNIATGGYPRSIGLIGSAVRKLRRLQGSLPHVEKQRKSERDTDREGSRDRGPSGVLRVPGGPRRRRRPTGRRRIRSRRDRRTCSPGSRRADR